MALLEEGAFLEGRRDFDFEALLGEGAPDADGPGVRIGGITHEDHGPGSGGLGSPGHHRAALPSPRYAAAAMGQL